MTQEAFQARMRAQCEAIQQYQSKVIREEGRDLTLEEAAVEWIELYADNFSNTDIIV
jgi:hypothetical protein